MPCGESVWLSVCLSHAMARAYTATLPFNGVGLAVVSTPMFLYISHIPYFHNIPRIHYILSFHIPSIPCSGYSPSGQHDLLTYSIHPTYFLYSSIRIFCKHIYTLCFCILYYNHSVFLCISEIFNLFSVAISKVC